MSDQLLRSRLNQIKPNRIKSNYVVLHYVKKTKWRFYFFVNFYKFHDLFQHIFPRFFGEQILRTPTLPIFF